MPKRAPAHARQGAAPVISAIKAVIFANQRDQFRRIAAAGQAVLDSRYSGGGGFADTFHLNRACCLRVRAAGRIQGSQVARSPAAFYHAVEARFSADFATANKVTYRYI
jgi:hypothetical protein